MKYYEDPILGKGRAADVTGGTGGGGTEYIGGFAIGISGDTISRLRYMSIESVTGNSVTLQAGHAYKAYATSTAITLNTETVPEGQFGMEGHIEIYVAGAGYVVTGTNVVLANALEPDSVNNCTLRFHDGVCIISVEDHVAGYIVVNGSTSGDGSLYYGITTSTNDYVAFDAALNGSVIPLAGAVAEGEKHLVGNGYTETTLTGAVDCGTSKFTVANLSLQDVVVNGGVMTLGDAYIPSGSTVEVSGGGLAVEKVTGAGAESVIDLGGISLTVANATAYINGVKVTHGGATTSGLFAVNNQGKIVASGVNFDNAGSRCINLGNDGKVEATDCSFKAAQNIGITGSSTSIKLSGSNSFNGTVASPNSMSGSVTLTSGAILDLTGNTNATPIAPGGGITFEQGGATVLYGEVGSVSSMFIDNAKIYGALTNSGGVAVTSVNGGTYTQVDFGGPSISQTLVTGNPITLVNCSVTGQAILISNAQGVAQTAVVSGTLNRSGTTRPFIFGNNGSDLWAGTMEFKDNCTITASNFTHLVYRAASIVVGSGVTINGNPISSGTYTSATIAADGTITEA